MNWFAGYHSKVLARIYDAEVPFLTDKLSALWPLFVGLGVLSAIDIGFGLEDPLRLILLVPFAAPGVVWAAYITFHEINALRIWLRRRKD